MGIRITGISTPVGGVTWECTDTNSVVNPSMESTVSNKKINVFISSICGEEKYDNVRRALKEKIEKTQLANVYIFEEEGASTLNAEDHYTFALENSDVCIFLIDNEDGIRPGVQKEIDTVKKRNIKALYYFCYENSQETTALEKGLKGAKFAKSKRIFKFDQLVQNGAQDLINDIVNIYRYYCQGRIVVTAGMENDMQQINIARMESLKVQIISKTVLENIDKCKCYILKLVTGWDPHHFIDGKEKTSEIDEWCEQFLSVMFEGKSIKSFNLGLLLETLEKEQTPEYYRIVQIRWKAIQAYFLNDVEKCITYLKSALELARETNQPTWVTNDILVDLRNKHWTLCTINSAFTNCEAQDELDNSDEKVYYPLLDRINESLHEEYMKGLYKKKTQSPYTITLGNSLGQKAELLASSYIVSMYNGSLTHILLFYEKIKDFLFYLCCTDDDWNFRRDLFKLAVYSGKKKEITAIQTSYPEVLNSLTAQDAVKVIDFCNNHPIWHDRVKSQLLAFGAVGYFLSDDHFKQYETILLGEIKKWLKDGKALTVIGESIFEGMSGVAYRMSQDTLAEICCLFIERHYSRWYIDMFRFIGNYIDLSKMNEKNAKKIVSCIIQIMENEQERNQIQYAMQFLCTLRKQNHGMTQELDNKIAECFPEFYGGLYKLETTEDKKSDYPEFINEYIEKVKNSNKTQGAHGTFYAHGTRDIVSIRVMLISESEVEYNSEIVDSVISTVAETLLLSKEDINTKIDALVLLMGIIVKYPDAYKRNIDIYNEIYQKVDKIDTAENDFMSTNIDSISLSIGLRVLFAVMGKEVYSDLLVLMPYIQGSIPTIIAVENIIEQYLYTAENVTFPQKIEALVLQNTLQWLQADYRDVRWHATKILFAMLRNAENRDIVNDRLSYLIDNDCAHIKNLILRNAYKVEGISDNTREHIISKCRNDSNFIVRLVCEEIEKDNENSDT